MVTDEFEVRWFRENTAGAVEDLGLGDPDQIAGMGWLSRYHNTAFRNQPYSPSLLGKYWCQVINTTADPDQPLMRSNVFTLLAPGDYSESLCTGTAQIQFIDNRTCADLPNSQSGQITSLVFQPVQTLLLQTSTTTLVVQTLTNSAMKSSDNTLIFTPYSTTSQPNVTHATFTDGVNHMTTTPHPSPTESVALVISITPIIAGVSAGVVLVLILIIFSTLVMILIVMKKKMVKHEKQQTHTGKNTYSILLMYVLICTLSV